MDQPEYLLEIGSRDGYQWLVSTNPLDDVLQFCPNVVVGKHLAITSFDSGVFVPSEEQQASGWKTQGGIAYSPKIQRIAEVPQEYYSEFYIFERLTDFGALADPRTNIFERGIRQGRVPAFVNFHIGLHDPNAVTELFWQQLAWIKPESYIADHDYLNFVTANPALFTSVREALRQRGK